MRRVREEEIPLKNYLICAIIFIVTISFGLLLFLVADNNKKYEKKIPLLRGYSKEIDPKDFDAYLNENPNILLYIGVADNDNSRVVEKRLKSIIEDNKIEIVYLNLTNYSEKKISSYLSKFSSYYFPSGSSINYPALIIFRDKKVVDYVYRKEDYLSISEIDRLIDIHELKGEKNA